MTPLSLHAEQEITLVDETGRPEQVHVFDEDSVLAVKAACAARRPLLVRGEPGVGKTQLASAVAAATSRPIVSRVVDSRTESRDLLWEFDAVMRLAEAQVLGPRSGDAGDWRDALAIQKFVRPGPVWFAFDWAGAVAQARRSNSSVPCGGFADDYSGGCVLLIDEIDKAESDVPNGLLEALGDGEFTPFGFEDPVHAFGEPPIVIITTNQERTLPDAFIRRCLVHSITMPGDREQLQQLFVSRGIAHFGARASQKLLERAALLVTNDRAAAKAASISPLPGQAEFLDLLRAVVELTDDEAEQLQLLDKVASFAVQKQKKDDQ